VLPAEDQHTDTDDDGVLEEELQQLYNAKIHVLLKSEMPVECMIIRNYSVWISFIKEHVSCVR
jgi:hypothetical protein